MIDDRSLTANWHWPISRGLWLCLFLFMALDLLATILYAEDFLNGEESYWSLMSTPGVWLLWFVGILFLAFGIYVQVWAND